MIKRSQLTEEIVLLTKTTKGLANISEEKIKVKAGIQADFCEDRNIEMIIQELPICFKNTDFTGILWKNDEYKIIKLVKNLKYNFIKLIIKKL